MRRKLTDEQIASFREGFVAAAERLFEKQGVAGVTMRQLAQAVGYSQTAAYSYFKNKDEILAAVRAAALDRFNDRLDAAYSKRKSARANARAVGQAYMQFAIDEPAAYRLIFNTDQADAMQYPAFVAARQRAAECMTRGTFKVWSTRACSKATRRSSDRYSGRPRTGSSCCISAV
jgi:AcrR family transcriptional regulator